MNSAADKTFISLEGHSIGETLKASHSLMENFKLQIIECSPLPSGKFLFWAVADLSDYDRILNFKLAVTGLSLKLYQVEFKWLKNLTHLQNTPKDIDALAVLESHSLNTVLDALIELEQKLKPSVLDFQKGRGYAGYAFTLLALNNHQIEKLKEWKTHYSNSDLKITMIETLSDTWKNHYLNF